jgi:hypothetical protein
MKTTPILVTIAFAIVTNTCMAQLPAMKPVKDVPVAVPSTPSTPASSPTSAADTAAVAVADSLADNHLDKAIAAVNTGDKAAANQELTTAVTALEKEIKNTPNGSLKDKLMGQASSIKQMLPMLQKGVLKGDVLKKAAGATKLMLAYQRVEGLLGGAGSLVSKLTPMTANLKGLGTAMAFLGPKASGGQSLLTGALSGLSKLGQGGPAAAAAEPAVKGQIGKLLDFVKVGL